MSETFRVRAIDAFLGVDRSSTQIVFHGINKSGSYALAKTMQHAYQAAGREGEFNSHYFLGGPLVEFTDRVEAWAGPGFHVAHYLYGALRAHPNRVWITQFRHPLPRVLSCYNWLKNKHQAKNSNTPFPSLDEWVVHTKGKAHSMVVQFGAGFGVRSKGLVKRLKPEDLFELTLGALERDVYCIGIAEYFEETIFLIAALAGLPHVSPWVRDKRNPGRPLSSEITDTSRALIEDVYQYDFKLYEYALSRFRKQLENAAFGPELQAYKSCCEAEYNDRLIGC